MARKPEYDRDLLIEKARDLFWAQGWAGTSMKDLEAGLGVKPGSFYAAFGSKDALFELALERYAEDGLARIQALSEELGPLQALQSFPKLVIERKDAPAKACMLSKTLLELQAKAHPLASTASAHLLRMEAAFAELQAETGADFVHPYNDPRVIAGQGTCARELLEQTDGLDMVIAPIGGGGMVSGTCLTLSNIAPEVEILAAEPAQADDAHIERGGDLGQAVVVANGGMFVMRGGVSRLRGEEAGLVGPVLMAGD